MKIDRFEILKGAAQDLSQVPYVKILELISLVNLSSMVSFKLPVEEKVFRMRRSEDKEFNHQCQITYNPKASAWGRVHKPGNPMFYGSIGHPDSENPVITNTAETLHILMTGGHDISKKPVKVTCGSWKILKPIPTIPMVFDKESLKKYPNFKITYNGYKNHKFTNDRDLEILHFIAEQFSKKDIKNPDNDYKISVAFTEYCFKDLTKGIGSIIYPSIRSRDKGFNIALTPNYVKEYLRLHEVATFVLRFDGRYIQVEDDKIASEIHEDGSFILK